MTVSNFNLGAALRSAFLLLVFAPLMFVGCEKMKDGATKEDDAGIKTEKNDVAKDSQDAKNVENVKKSTANNVKPKVGVYTLKAQRVPILFELPGRVVAYKTSQVRPLVTGYVLERCFEEGAMVEKDQVLYKLDSTTYQANYDRAQANVENLEAAMNREKSLKEKNATSEQSYEDSVRNWKIAQADFELAKTDLARCEIKAPISGMIGFSKITEGSLVTNGQVEELTRIEQLDPIFVDVKPSMRALLKAMKERRLEDDQEKKAAEKEGEEVEADDVIEEQALDGLKVNLHFEDGTEYDKDGLVKIMDNSVNLETGSLTLRAEFPNPYGILLPGMYVRATIEADARENGLLVPLQAVFRTAKGEPYVWILNESKVERRMIETDLTFGVMALIDSGLQEGDRVVVEGTQYVGEGIEVEATEKDDLPTELSTEK